MNFFNGLFPKMSDPDARENNKTYIPVLAVTIIMVLFIPMSLCVILLSSINPITAGFIYGFILLDLIVLFLIKKKNYKAAITIFVIFGGVLVSLCVFSLSIKNIYEIYMLTSFHLSILAISVFITYSIRYAYISAGIALLSIILHYIIRAGSYHTIILQNIEDYIVCTCLITISFIVMVNIVRHRLKLFRKIEEESEKAFNRARDLELKNNELQNLYNEKQNAEEKYRILVEAARDAIFIVQDNRIKFPNAATIAMMGYSENELLKTHFRKLIHKDDRSMVEERHKLRIKGHNLPGNYSFRVISKAGDLIWVELNTSFILWKDEPATINIMRDITQQKRLEAQYQHAQKMQAIGTLAGGIAHDFNNILTGIFGFASLAKNHINEPEKAEKNIDQVLQSGLKAAALVQQILTVSRQSDNEKKLINIMHVVREALNLLNASLPSTIKIKNNLYSKKPILADPTKIHQIVMNLCTNAYHAMVEKGGTLNVSLKEIVISDQNKYAAEQNIPEGDYVKIQISDTGSGIAPEALKKIFDPYFTTKPSEQGTGLGLAIVSGIVEEHNGYLTVQSELEKGSTFSVFFPIAEDELKKAAPQPEKIVIQGGSETIMVVEDEDEILVSLNELLTDYGYNVCTFSNGSQAFQEFKKAPDSFDLIITDMTMPEMTGWELSQKVLEIDPDQKILICTGFNEKINKNKALDLGISGYFEKPLITDDLLKWIRSALDNKKKRSRGMFNQNQKN